MLSQNKAKPSWLVNRQGVLSLSGKALGEILRTGLAKGFSFRFKAKGFSMSPFIKDEDIVTISPLTSSVILRGKIVALLQPQTEKLVIHRVITAKEDFILSKGDNSPVADGYIPKKNIIGQVTSIERKGKKVFIGLGSEKKLISILSSKGFLSTLFKPIRKILSWVKTAKP